MTTQAGLWIDHQQAVIVTLRGQEEAFTRITSEVDKRTHYAGGSRRGPNQAAHAYSSEDGRDRRTVILLNRFYDAVIEVLQGAEALLIIGPGEAKVELRKRLEARLPGCLVQVDSADKLTDRQIAAAVRAHFAKMGAQPSR